MCQGARCHAVFDCKTDHFAGDALQTMSVPVDWDVSEDMPDQVMTKLLKDKNRRLTQQLAGLLEHQGKTLQKVGELEMRALVLERQLKNPNGNRRVQCEKTNMPGINLEF